MLSSLETPRPRPPAQVRKANAMQQKMSSSPPPAYGSPFTFPARRQMRQDILGSPMATTFQMVGWDQTSDTPTNDSETAPDELAWMNEKSREELKDLLLKADVLIKQRENELGLTSAVCKGLYQNNVALKTKHQALLAQIPTSPARSTSSPGNLYISSLPCNEGTSITTSYSESTVGLIRSPSPMLYKRHARKVSIAADDVSLLADQNAELLDKLEKLEKEATAADHAGRRELKRLEKEITFLRDALETTQARSDELEEKVQVTVASEAWRRKKEREAKFRAMRNLGRDSSSDSTDEDSKVQNFAPEGSTFGGPSETFSFFPIAESPDPNRRRLPNISEDSDILTSATSFNVDVKGSSLRPHEHALISQLLIKVQELEETNAKILQQQSDTATQLSAVQRDTAHISRVYECLSDHTTVELELAQRGWDEDEENDNLEEGNEGSSGAIQFKSLKRSLASELGSIQDTYIVRPEFTSSGKNRKTVMGLFDTDLATEDEQEDHPPSATDEKDTSSISVVSSPWSEGHDNSSWSSSIAGIGGAVSPLSRLSPLHFFSPPSQGNTELSPLEGRDTLQSELDRELSRSWSDMQDRNDQFNHNHHLRMSSLYDLGQISIPPSPSPTSRVSARRDSDDLDVEDVRAALAKSRDESTATTTNEHTPRSSALLMPTNTLQLSVEPPTPEARRLYQLRTADPDDDSKISPAKSPRVQLISEALRSRSHRWVDRRFRRRSKERSAEREWTKNNFDAFVDASEGVESGNGGGAGAKNLAVAILGNEVAAASIAALVIPKRLMSAVDNMIDGFESVTRGVREGPSSDLANSYDHLADEAGDSDMEVFYSPPITPRVHVRRRITAEDRYISPIVNSRHNRDLEVDDEPNARPHAHGENTGATDTQLLSLTSPRKNDADYAHQSFLLKFWLWVQFAIVIFVFLYAMARRGPTIILSDESKNKRAVARRR